MTLWVTYHKAVLDEKDKKNEYHSALFGVIYCLCFFGLKTGQTTCRVVMHNLLLMFEVFCQIAWFSFTSYGSIN